MIIISNNIVIAVLGIALLIITIESSISLYSRIMNFIAARKVLSLNDKKYQLLRDCGYQLKTDESNWELVYRNKYGKQFTGQIITLLSIEDLKKQL
jgi:hypothetical protein